MADLLLEVPQNVEQRLDDFFAARGRLARQQEQQIDVGAGREQASAIAADRHDGDAPGFRPGGVEEAHGHVVDGADDLVFEIAEPRGAGAAGAAVLQRASRLGAALLQSRAKEFDRRAPERRIVRRRFAAKRFQLGRRAARGRSRFSARRRGTGARVERRRWMSPWRGPSLKRRDRRRAARRRAAWLRSRPRSPRRGPGRRTAESPSGPSAKSR